jgi:hypothetical protein
MRVYALKKLTRPHVKTQKILQEERTGGVAEKLRPSESHQVFVKSQIWKSLADVAEG